jgi:hypothetical protein
MSVYDESDIAYSEECLSGKCECCGLIHKSNYPCPDMEKQEDSVEED